MEAERVVPLGSLHINLHTTPATESCAKYRSQLDQVKHNLGADVISSKAHFKVRAGSSSFGGLCALAMRSSLVSVPQYQGAPPPPEIHRQGPGTLLQPLEHGAPKSKDGMATKMLTFLGFSKVGHLPSLPPLKTMKTHEE